MPDFTCPGIDAPQPPNAPHEGFVACYRAGHGCPPHEATRTVSGGYVQISYRCPCCGDYGTSVGYPVEWGDFAAPESLRAGLNLEGRNA